MKNLFSKGPVFYRIYFQEILVDVENILVYGSEW